MWARTLRSARCRLQLPRHPVRIRQYNSQQFQGPHTTYFQQPEPVRPSRTRRALFLVFYGASTFTLGAGALLLAMQWGMNLDLVPEEMEETMGDVLIAGTCEMTARTVPPMTVEAATELIHSRSGYSVTPRAVGHTSQLASNMPIEDTWSSGAFTFFKDPAKDWCEWAIFDGHAGARTANVLREHLPSIVGGALSEAKCLDQAYRPNDLETINTIKKAFRDVDQEIIEAGGKIIESGGPLAEVVASGAAAFSGSCALLALYDPARAVLRVANVGDSRAVLGRYDPLSKKYIAMAMSVDQTGFNQEEVARLKQEHPDEDDVVDPKTGRVHGLAVTRAFGDARWKWAQSLTQLAHDKFWGPSPRPNGMIKTPPYLTAEPEILETRVQTGDQPDFLIMASDGLWDLMSNEDAVACVQMWLQKNKPTAFLDEQPKTTSLSEYLRGAAPRLPSYSSASDLAGDDDTYYDEDEKCLKWRVSPKHFVVEDEHCGVHLIKNALGGKRRDLFTGVMTVQPPLSRYVRDDITVHVIFFGVDVKQ